MWKILLYTQILLFSITSVVNSDGQCGRIKITTPFALSVGGIASKPGQWPWLASLFHSEKGYLCGSSIISQWHLLSAAHCVLNEANFYSALLGRFNLSDSEEGNWMQRSIKSIHSHSDFDRNGTQLSNGDIAIFKVTRKILYTDHIQPICLPEASSSHLENIEGIVAGYGINEILGQHQNTPSHVKLMSVSPWKCLQKGQAYREIVSERSFCAGSPDKKSIPCQGDSGGGYYVFDQETRQFTILGITSYAVGLCDPSHYVAFSDVTKYIPWIREIIPDILPTESSECTSNSDCENNRKCIRKICIDLCLDTDSCAEDAICSMQNHRLKCQCKEGYEGDGYEECKKMETPLGFQPTSQSILQSGACLEIGKFLKSPNGCFKLLMQQDGNLVIYRISDSINLWQSRTRRTNSNRVCLQTSGEFVIYNQNLQSKWRASHQNYPGSEVKLQDDGNLVLYQPNTGKILWHANVNSHC